MRISRMRGSRLFSRRSEGLPGRGSPTGIYGVASDVIATRLRISLGASIFALHDSTGPARARPCCWRSWPICISFFATTCLSVNYYAIPLDLFGSVSAGFAVSLLTGVFGLMQAFLSPVIGGSSEKFGWQPVCVAIAALPLASALLLQVAFRKR